MTPQPLAPPRRPVLAVAAVGALVLVLVARGASFAPSAVGRSGSFEARPLGAATTMRTVPAVPARGPMTTDTPDGGVTRPEVASEPPQPMVASSLPAADGLPRREEPELAATAESELRPSAPTLVLAPTAAAPVVVPASTTPTRAPDAPLAAAASTTAGAVTPPAVGPIEATPPQAPAPSGRERLLLEAMNAQRVAAGVPALLLNSTLTQAARLRSQDMASRGYFAHVSPSGQSWYSALAAVGWTVSGGGENLAKVAGDEPTSVAVAVDHLMASPTHRANIVSRAFRFVGIGATVDASGATIFTTIFTDR